MLFFLLVKNSLLFLQLQSILEGSKALIGIDETRKAERLRGALRKSVRASGFNCNNNANIWWWTTAFTHRACYGRLWDDIHLSGHFTCRLESWELFCQAAKGKISSCSSANSISQLVDVVKYQ